MKDKNMKDIAHELINNCISAANIIKRNINSFDYEKFLSAAETIKRDLNSFNYGEFLSSVEDIKSHINSLISTGKLGRYEQKYIIAKHDPVNNKIKVAVKSESEFPNVKLTLGPTGTVEESVQRWPIYTGNSDSSAHTP